MRTGPSSFDYPIIGTIPVGGTAPAVGRSPAGEWIQIIFPDGPLGTGWVYAANVSLSPGANLPIVEPPPTPVPLETPTLNPTYVAAFQIVPTFTRQPTFTSPPPLQLPTYTNPVEFLIKQSHGKLVDDHPGINRNCRNSFHGFPASLIPGSYSRSTRKM